MSKKKGWSQNRLAKELGVAQSSVSDALALLDLPEVVQRRVDAGEVSPSTARKVLRVADPERQRELIDRAASGETRAGVDAEVKAARSTVDRSRRRPRKVTSRTFRAEGCKVTVENRRGLDAGAIRSALLAVLAQIDGATEQARGDAA